MSEYQFTQDWFKWSPPVWQQLIQHLPARKNFLEIGSFEGRSAVWIIENMMEDGGEIVCIDTWEGGAEHVNNEMDGAELRFEHNIKTVREKHPERRVTKCRGLSTQWLPAVTQEKYSFDFIYIDGSHLAKDVLTDACMSWPLLKKGGFMVFDDYIWKPPGFTLLDRPKFAVDVFTTLFENELVIAYSGYQLIVRKV